MTPPTGKRIAPCAGVHRLVRAFLTPADDTGTDYVDMVWSSFGLGAMVTASRDQQRIIRYGDQRIPVALTTSAVHRLERS